MLPRPYLLSVLLLLLPLIAIIDGLAMAPLAVGLFALLAWHHRSALADWRHVYASARAGFIIVLLLIAWPMLSYFWSILPVDSFATALHAGGFLLLAPLAVGCAGRKENKADPALWALPGFGVALAALFVMSGRLPHAGLIGWMTRAFKMNEELYATSAINRGLCVLSVLVWPAALGLWHAGKRKAALVFPWLVLVALFCFHSLSAKVGLLAGMVAFYGMLWRPQGGRRILVWAVPLAFIASPFIFHAVEPMVRRMMYADLPGSSQHRVEIWHFAYQKWQERPWLGWGVDSSRAIPGGLKEFRPGMVYLPLHPHNLALNVLLEQGLAGFGLFTLALALFTRRALPAADDPPEIVATRAAAMIAYLAIGMSGFGMWQGWWIATGLTAFMMTVFAEKTGDANENPRLLMEEAGEEV